MNIKKMKRSLYILICVSFCSTILINCKRIFNPDLEPIDTGLLVVEGQIEGNAPINFKISRTRALYVNDTGLQKFELHARVLVEDDHHNTYPLTEMGGGNYGTTVALNLNSTYQYRLHIYTADNREYASDFIPFKSSPPIDTIGWKFKDGGVQVFANTHDATNSTHYYRWEYTETWEFNSSYRSIIRYDTITKTVVYRTEQIYTCWHTNNSPNILLETTTKLSNDIVNETPLIYIPDHDQRLFILYSILVKQFALDEKGYNYWIAMKANTENTGSISDPQPSQLEGNIRCLSNPSEKVVGYINAGNTDHQRIFISNTDMPSDWYQSPICEPITSFSNENPFDLYLYLVASPANELINYKYDDIGNIIGYYISTKECVDCRLHGVNVKPSFWP